ncbi:hypothetical protein AAVH_32537, partial [Aphelenchoides avenae]
GTAVSRSTRSTRRRSLIGWTSCSRTAPAGRHDPFNCPFRSSASPSRQSKRQT